jgi:hypothetical protein
VIRVLERAKRNGPTILVAHYTQPEMADVDAGAFAGTLVGNPAELGLLRTNFRTADPAALAAFKRAFAADLTDDEFRTVLNTFQPDENLDVGTSADRAQATTWGRIPRTYVRAWPPTPAFRPPCRTA